MKSEMEELFADLCQVPRLVARRAGFRPALDVYRTDDPPAVTVVVELAGIDPDEVDAAVVDGGRPPPPPPTPPAPPPPIKKHNKKNKRQI